MQLVIGNQNYSSWSLRPWMLLEYFSIPFQEKHISLMTPDMREQMAGICPNYKVPVLLDQGEKVWDSLAICEYINEQYLNGKAWPSATLARATARAICAEMHSGFPALRNEMPMNCRKEKVSLSLTEEANYDIARVQQIWQECLAKSNGPYLFGEFSIADAYFMPVVSRFNTYNIDGCAVVSQYMATMLALPAYQKWLDASLVDSRVIDEDEV